MSAPHLSPLRKADVVLGKPLPWPVYDRERKLLLRQGFVIASFNQVERLLAAGLYRVVDDFFPQGPGSSNDAGADGAGASGQLSGIVSPSTPFINTRIPVGSVIQLTNPLADQTQRDAVRLIGFLEKKSLLVSHPAQDGELKYVKEGTSYHCRAFAGKNAYAFDTSVLRVALAPYPYMHLSYPGGVHTNVVRKAARVATEIVATAEEVGRGKPTTCTIQDLSTAGALLHSSQPVSDSAANIRIAFRLSIDEARTLFEIDAEIRSVHKDEESGKNVVRTGVRFLDLDIAIRRELELYIYRKMVDAL